MRFSSLITSALLTTTTLAQVSILKDAVEAVDTAMKKLDATVLAYKSTSTNMTLTLTTQTEAVQSILQKAITDITASQPITLIDALSLQQGANSLLNNVKTTMNDLVAKASEIEKVQGTSEILLKSLKAQSSGANGLADALAAKLPSFAQGLAKNAIKQVVAAIDRGVAAFGGKVRVLRVERLRLLEESIGEMRI